MSARPFVIDGVEICQPKPGDLIPPRAFTSSEFFETELRAIFRRSWVHIADLADLSAPGDFVTSSIGRAPVFALRGTDGALRGFLNSCRHRHAAVVDGSGNCGRRITCPYHAWSYDTRGQLVSVPFREEFQRDPDGSGLMPIRIATLGPMVFGCLDEDAPPFDAWAGVFEEDMADIRGSDLEPVYEFTYEIPVNWKAYAEINMEAYHFDVVHELLRTMVDSRTAVDHLHAWGSHTDMETKPEVRGLLQPGAELCPARASMARFAFIFPNLVAVTTPVEFAYLRIDPIAPESVLVRSRAFDHGGPARGLLAFRRDSYDKTSREDIEIATRLQRGMRAERPERGLYGRRESRIGHFEGLVIRELARYREEQEASAAGGS